MQLKLLKIELLSIIFYILSFPLLSESKIIDLEYYFFNEYRPAKDNINQLISEGMMGKANIARVRLLDSVKKRFSQKMKLASGKNCIYAISSSNYLQLICLRNNMRYDFSIGFISNENKFKDKFGNFKYQLELEDLPIKEINSIKYIFFDQILIIDSIYFNKEIKFEEDLYGEDTPFSIHASLIGIPREKKISAHYFETITTSISDLISVPFQNSKYFDGEIQRMSIEIFNDCDVKFTNKTNGYYTMISYFNLKSANLAIVSDSIMVKTLVKENWSNGNEKIEDSIFIYQQLESIPTLYRLLHALQLFCE